MKSFAILIFALVVALQQTSGCTITTVSGSHTPENEFCAGDLIFEDNFDTLDEGKWKHEKTLSGGGNFEFQWYVDDRQNSFVQDGSLHLRPTYTEDVLDIYNERAEIPSDECTKSDNWGCERSAGGDNIINPIRSAMITTIDSFSFKYGTLEIRAKNPAGDWLWPALWMMPKNSAYGDWPRSGEIDLMESRGNRNLLKNDVHVGHQQVGSTLHFGPAWNQDAWETAHKTKNNYPPYDDNFHIYKLVWTDQYIQFYVDDEMLTQIDANDGFWARGGFEGENIWSGGEIMAPFDQEFFIQLNLAVGGNMYFDDKFVNGPEPKPWKNSSPSAMKDFWEGKSQWEPTWNLSNDDRHFVIDYVRVYAA